MRPIKFRGLSKVQPHLGYVFGYYYAEHHYGKPCVHIIRQNNGDLTIVDEKTVSQFIGLQDKNGKEIYEGDILNIGEDHDYQKNLIVKWSDKECAFVLDNGTIRSFSFISTENPVVVGNIHEHTHLITQ